LTDCAFRLSPVRRSEEVTGIAESGAMTDAGRDNPALVLRFQMLTV